MKKFFICLGILALASGCRIAKNFHEIDPGKMYRSAQLTPAELRMAVDKIGLKTVINLRGKSAQKWYLDEKAVLEELGVELVDIGMSAKVIPHRENLLKLLETFESAERPLLIHCQAGADRTGEASALYQILYMDKTNNEAKKMLSPEYLHFPSVYPAKRYLVSLFKGIDWAVNEYFPCNGDLKYYNVNNPFCEGKGDTSAHDDDGESYRE